MSSNGGSNFWNFKKNFAIPLTYVFAVGAVVVVILLVLLSKWAVKASGSTKEFNDAIQRLVSQSSQWGMAASQDSSILLRLMHANYAIAYLRAAKLLASEQDIKKITSIDVYELQRALEDQQQNEVARLADTCPALKSETSMTVGAGMIT